MSAGCAARGRAGAGTEDAPAAGPEPGRDAGAAISAPPGRIAPPRGEAAWAEPPAEGEARELAEGLLWMRLPMPWRLDHVNVYALDEGDGWTILDTGIASRHARAVWDRLLAGPLAGRPVRQVVVSHHHPDHVGLAGWFVRRGAELRMTRTAWLTTRMLVLDVQERPDPRVLEFWRAAGMAPAILAARAAARPYNMADIVEPLPPGFRRLVEGEALRLGGRDWRVRLGQGHAPDQATFWGEGLILAADQILARISPNISVHASEPEADPLGEWMASCRALAGAAEMMPDAVVLPGHDLPFRAAAARLRQMEANHAAALDRLEAGLAEPRAACDCFALLFRRSVGEEDYTLALGETLAHLNRLRAEGRVTRDRAGDGPWLWRRA